MTTKYIYTTYTGGYTLAPAYAALDILTPGTIEGGLTLTGGHAVQITNNGKVVGVYGGSEEAGGVGLTAAGAVTLTGAGLTVGGRGGSGGAGGVGVSLASASYLSTKATITGGAGGGVFSGRGGAGGAGVSLASGSRLATAGTITGGAAGATGIYGAGGAGAALASGSSMTMTAGKVAGGEGDYYGGGGAGVALASGASLSMTAGTIDGGVGGDRGYGGAGVALASEASLMLTAGTITGGAGGYGGFRYGEGGAGGAGIYVGEGSSLTMTAGTLIGGEGGYSSESFGGRGGAGIKMEGGSLTLTAGTIAGGTGGFGTIGNNGISGAGIDMYGGNLINGDAAHHAALIKGSTGIIVSGAGTVTNFATIQASNGPSVSLYGSGARLIAEPGSVFISVVLGGGGAKLELAGGTGTITGLGSRGTLSGAETMTFSGFGSYLADVGASWTLAGTDILAASQTVVNAGTVTGTLGLGAGSDRVILETGGVFNGIVHGGGGALELAGGTGTITGLGATGTVSGAEAMTFSGFGSYDFDAGASWMLEGTNDLAAGQTLSNAGTLNGIFELGGASDRVILQTGGVFSGIVKGDGAALELAGGSGTITGLGGTGTVSGAEAMTFSGFASYGVDAGASWMLAGTNALAAGQTLTNAGTLSVAGSLNNAGGIVGGVDLSTAAARLIAQAGSSITGLVIGRLGTLELAGGSGTITGLGATGTLSGAEAMTFVRFGSYDLDAAGDWTLTGTNAVAGRLTNAGSLTIAQTATLNINGAMTNSGIVDSAGQELTVFGTLTNAGAIVGPVGLSGATARVIVEAGSSITGRVTGGGGTLELAGGSGTITRLGSTGTLSGAEALTFSGFGSYDFDVGDAWTLTGKKNSAASLTNAGNLTIANSASLTVQGAVSNSGVLTIDNGDLTLNGAVSGTGTAVINAGTLDAGSTFTQNVTFGKAGELELADATAYAGSISGFSKRGKTFLDLRDIGFVGSSEASFSGTAAGGVLTVTDGTNTARITLVGNYTHSAFTASSDGHGGTIVVDPAAPPRSPPSPHAFAAAMAGLRYPAGEALQIGPAPPPHAAVLAAPRTQMA